MDFAFTLLEWDRASGTAPSGSAHSPPGSRQRGVEPDEPSFGEVLEKSRKRQAEEGEEAQLGALSTLSTAGVLPPDDLNPVLEGSLDGDSALDGVTVLEGGPAGEEPSSGQVSGEEDPAQLLQAVVKEQFSTAMGRVTATAGQVASVGGAQSIPGTPTVEAVSAPTLTVQPEVSAQEGEVSASSLVAGVPVESGGDGAQAVQLPVPPDLPPSPMDLSRAASGHLLEMDAPQEVPYAPSSSVQAQNSVSQTVGMAEREPLWTNAANESGGMGQEAKFGASQERSGQENRAERVGNSGLHPGDVYGAAEKAAQQARAAEVKSFELARQAEAQEPQLAAQINKAVLEMTRNGHSLLRLTLEPEDLGVIALQVMKGPDGLQVRMSAEMQATAALLESRQAELEQALQVSGVNLAGLSIAHHAPQEQSANRSRWLPRKLSSRGAVGLDSSDDSLKEQDVPLRRIRFGTRVDYQI